MPSIRSIPRALAVAAGSVVLVAGLATPASAVAVGEPQCGATPPPTYVCVQEVPNGPRIPVATVLGVNLNPTQLANVVGYLESYRVPTGPSSYTDIPCVVLVTNGTTTDECANLGLSQTPDVNPIPLVSRNVDSYNPTVKRLVDFYICQGRVTATVAGFGPSQVIATLCYDIAPGSVPAITLDSELDLGTWSL